MNRNLKANLGICALLAAGLTLFLMLPLTLLVIGGASLSWQTGGPILASVAACLFVLSFLLLLLFHLRDERRLHRSYLRIKTHLQSATNKSGDDFQQHFSEIDPALLLQVRQLLANFFEVAVEKIVPENFPSNFQHEEIQPRLSAFVHQQLQLQNSVVSEAEIHQLLERMSATVSEETVSVLNCCH